MAVKPPKLKKKKKFGPVQHKWRILRVFLRVFQIFDRSRDELYAWNMTENPYFLFHYYC